MKTYYIELIHIGEEINIGKGWSARSLRSANRKAKKLVRNFPDCLARVSNYHTLETICYHRAYWDEFKNKYSSYEMAEEDLY